MHTKDVMYLGGNRVFKFWERGEKWKVISPDLSNQDPKKILTTGSGAENYAVVYALAESPVKARMIWAGSDDGKLWITENEGDSWTDLTDNLPKNVKGQWISRIEPSHFDTKTAYIAIDAHRSNNFSPLAYRTSDGGKTWNSIAGNLPDDGPVKVLREDLTNPNLLFAGTEFHLFVSTNRGEQWSVFGDLPTVAVDDIVIHPRENDLVIATHGRSIYVVDDIHPLQEFVDSVRVKDVYVFKPRPAYGRNLLPGFADFNGTTVYRGSNPPDGAIISYFIKEFKGEGVAISIADTNGHTVANLSGTNTPGINRVVWDLKFTKDLLAEYGSQGQTFVKPGIYVITLSSGKLKHSQKITVDIAPGLETR